MFTLCTLLRHYPKRFRCVPSTAHINSRCSVCRRAVVFNKSQYKFAQNTTSQAPGTSKVRVRTANAILNTPDVVWVCSHLTITYINIPHTHTIRTLYSLFGYLHDNTIRCVRYLVHSSIKMRYKCVNYMHILSRIGISCP